jgi:hypothetical protein
LISRQKIKLLHLAKRELGWSDDLYRQVLRDHGGVASSLDLDDEGFRRVIDHAKALGFWVQRRRKLETFRDASDLPTVAQLKIIEHLRHDLCVYVPGLRHANFWRGFLVKRLGVPALGPQTRAQANRVIEALKQRLGRAMRAQSHI